MSADAKLERRILIGMIASTDFMQQIRGMWNPKLMHGQMTRLVASWCVEYYDNYREAPGMEIEGVYYQKLREGLSQELAEAVEQDFLPGLSEEYEKGKQLNVKPLYTQTKEYFDDQNLNTHIQDIDDLLKQGRTGEAKQKLLEFQDLPDKTGKGLDFSDPEIFERIHQAFTQADTPVVDYPRQIGEFWNDQLVKGGFIGLMGPEKRGKSYWLLDLALRTARQGGSVVYFDAGDMTEGGIIKRICTYLTKKSHKESQSGILYQPTRDCIHNQRDTCDKDVRDCDFGVFPDKDPKQLREEVTKEEIMERFEQNPDYTPCYNCREYWDQKKWGCVWYKKVDVGSPLNEKEAMEAVDRMFVKREHQFKMANYPSHTLTTREVERMLDIWWRQENFLPSLVIIDYADIMESEKRGDKRDQIDDVWSKLRGISQKWDCLLVTGTQSDAASYEQHRLSSKNFSEDKRKLAHVTAMYGLNQDKHGREKKIGIMRLNKIVVREEAFVSEDEVYVLQNLNRGQPCIGSFW